MKKKELDAKQIVTVFLKSWGIYPFKTWQDIIMAAENNGVLSKKEAQELYDIWS